MSINILIKINIIIDIIKIIVFLLTENKLHYIKSTIKLDRIVV